MNFTAGTFAVSGPGVAFFTGIEGFVQGGLVFDKPLAHVLSPFRYCYVGSVMKVTCLARLTAYD